MTGNTSFDLVIKALLDEDHPFPAKFLQMFSDLDSISLNNLLKSWPEISSTRKVNLLEDLESQADLDTLLSFDDLAWKLLDDPLPEVRTIAIQLLGECEDPKLALKFIRILEEDSIPVDRVAAASALGLFIDLGELDKLSPGLLILIEEALIKAFYEGESPQLKCSALESLGASSRTEVNGMIEDAISNPAPAWKQSALVAMGRSTDQVWEKQVISHLRHPNDDVRLEAIQAAGELNLDSARKPLLRMLDDELEDNDQRRAILWSLSQVGGEDVQERLEELLDMASDDDEEQFLQEALENLKLSEEVASFNLLDLDPEVDFNLDDDQDLDE